MTYAESISQQIDHQVQELGVIRDALAVTPVPQPGTGGWDAREILLHLIGATKEIPDDLLQPATGRKGGVAERQPGGEYFDIPEIPTAAHAADALLKQLGVLRRAVRDLDDEVLQRPVTVMGGDGHPIPNVPIWLVVRHALAEHFDEHMTQLREAVAPVHGG
jgi:hypothetical protein